MKHSAGRKERRMQIRQNRRSDGKKKAKWNNWMSSHPHDKRPLKEKQGALSNE